MICEHCGKNNHNSATVCRSCGQKLHRSEVRIPLRYGKTHRPVTDGDDSLRDKAASPNEYFPNEIYYGEQQPFQGAQENRPAASASPASPYYAPPAYNAPPGYAPPYAPPVSERRKSRVPYLVVSFLTALVSVLCFLLPFQEWVSFDYQLLGESLSNGRLSLMELARRFYENKSIVSLITGSDNEYLDAILPGSVQGAYTQARLTALVLAAVFVLALVLFVLFILMVLLRLRGAAASLGITASLLYGGASVGVMFAVRRLNEIVIQYDDVSWNLIEYKLLNAPYYALATAILIFILCIVFAALGAGTKRK